MKHARKALPGFVGLMVVLVLAAVTASDVGQNPSDFHEIGFYQSESDAKIFAIVFSNGKNETNIIHHARRLAYADGQVTAAYYFQEGVTLPAEIMIRAGSIIRANAVLYEAPGLDPWRYAFLRSADGSQIFVDCKTRPSENLCRQ